MGIQIDAHRPAHRFIAKPAGKHSQKRSALFVDDIVKSGSRMESGGDGHTHWVRRGQLILGKIDRILNCVH
jgi:hypothetical protein